MMKKQTNDARKEKKKNLILSRIERLLPAHVFHLEGDLVVSSINTKIESFSSAVRTHTELWPIVEFCSGEKG